MRCLPAFGRRSTSMERTNPRGLGPLSLPACRRLLGHAAEPLSDDELTRLRDQLYAVGRCAVAVFVASASDTDEVTALDCLPAEAREEVEERAAIVQFDAKLPRGLASRAAVSAYLTAAKKRR
jgi:hypothetical protein